MKEKVIQFVKENSYFSFDQEDEVNDGVVLIFSTRENGDVLEEMCSDIDYNAGLKLKRALIENFKGVKVGIEVSVEDVDEWVIMDVVIEI